ncbi:MAG: 4Fe-4S dicluster domain-containing protein [Planctomycetota bacterium]|jgi:anaerobic dimethyl sulfoxide reductase subunit B (iron-sulfur subunit)
MSTRLGFRVDLRSCTGCKACQLACKDKHGHEPGVLWRRIVEVSGGRWVRRDALWLDESCTYYVSLSCMHCARPICVEVCPTKAMAKQKDGIVAVDPERCMGCRCCEWACPYRAPQFDPTAGVMTKCDLCRDHLEAGRDPACVEACPMRVLEVEDFATGGDGGDETFPLPPAALTEPQTALSPHRDVARAEAGEPRVGNEEEL